MSHERRNRIPSQRWLALAMLSLEIGAVGFLSKTYVVPILVALIGFLGAFSKIRVEITRQRLYDTVALVGIVYVLHYMFIPENPRYVQLFQSQQIAYNVSLFALTIQALLFFIKRKDDFLPFMFPALGVVALVCAAIVEVTMPERLAFQALCVSFSLLAVMYCNATRRSVDSNRNGFGRLFFTACTFVAVGLLGWFSASTLHRYEHQMDRFVRRFLQPGLNTSSIGFSETSQLGSVSFQKDLNSNQIALRVVSDVKPGYMRGRAFDIYETQRWSMVAEARNVPQLNHAPDGIEKSPNSGVYFRVGEHQPELNRYEVWPAFGGTYMAPLGSSYLHADSLLVAVDSHGILRSEDALPGVPYSVYAEGNGRAIDDRRRANNTRNKKLASVPKWAREDRQIQQLVAEIFKGCESTAERIQAVKSFFLDNFEYSTEVTVPTDYTEDSLRWFLLERPAAHCEYFASGTAILLRLAGVRCRYVTGFVVEELNDFSGDWVGRNKDAHAWVEAFDEELGWLIVESTPASGQPHASKTKHSTQFQEYLKDRLQRLRMAWKQHGIRLIGFFLIGFLTHPAGAFFTMIMAVFFIRRHLRARRDRLPKVVRPPDPQVVEMNKTLTTLERRLRRLKLIRNPSETLLQFADRIEQSCIGGSPRSTEASATTGASWTTTMQAVVAWLREYSALRFCRDRTPERIRANLLAASQLTQTIATIQVPTSDE